jgi:hypothetical protein
MAIALVDVRCEASGKDPTGIVRPGAFLTISAPTISVALAKDPLLGEATLRSKNGAQVGFVADTLTDIADLCADRNILNLSCVWIGTMKEKHASWLLTLVLRESNGICGVVATPGAYERVGLMDYLWNPDLYKNDQAETMVEWFREAEVKVVKIV